MFVGMLGFFLSLFTCSSYTTSYFAYRLWIGKLLAAIYLATTVLTQKGHRRLSSQSWAVVHNLNARKCFYELLYLPGRKLRANIIGCLDHRESRHGNAYVLASLIMSIVLIGLCRVWSRILHAQ